MPNESVDKALVTQFSDMVHVAAQQMKSRLAPYCLIKKMTGDNFAYDGLGTVEAREIQGRVQPVVFDDIEHTRRKIARRRFAVTLPIDASDVRGALLDPSNKYPEAIVAAMMRQKDRVISAAAFADVLTGRDFETTVTFANDGGFTVDATSGLTYEKLLEIKQNWIDADVGTDSPESMFLAIAGDEHTDLMGEAELISGDYSREYVIDQGEMQKALGMRLVKFSGTANNPVLTESGGERFCIAATKNAFCLGVSKEFSIEVQKRTDYYETTQVQIIGQIGAVRTEGKLIQKVRTTPT